MRGLLLAAAALLAGCYDSAFGEKTEPALAVPATTTLGELRERFAGQTFVVENDLAVVGLVMTSDRAENFYRTFCIEADGAAMEIMAGLDHLHNDYPEGCTVTVRLQGRALGESRGVLQLGSLPVVESGYPTDYLASRAALDATVVRHGEALQAVVPTRRALGELTPAMCGTLVRIEGLHYAPEALSAASWAGYCRFMDETEAEIYTYVRTYARFADAEVPAGRCALTGILQYDGSRYLLKLRDENDCLLQ